MRPVIVARAATSALPAPASTSGVVRPYAVEVPYSKRYVVAVPFGFTTPVTTAEPVVTDSDGPVEAVGAAWNNNKALRYEGGDRHDSGVNTRPA